MTSTRISTENSGNNGGFLRTKILHAVVAALFLALVAGMVQPCAFAQAPGAAPGRGAAAAPPQRGNPNGIKVYFWAGPKTHGEGQHDYPLFLADWSKLLMERGAAKVDGGLHPPTAADLEGVDVVIIYVGDSGYLTDQQKAGIDAYVKRGGGFVHLHDALCGPDPAYLASILGAGKKHGEVNFTLEAPISYVVTAKDDPIMKDMTDLTIWDESFYLLTWAKDGVQALATNKIPPTRSAGTHAGEVVPQIWKYEHTVAGGQPSRAFAFLQGHTYSNFSNYQIQRTLLRGIAWAAKRPVDELVDYVAPTRPAPGAPPAGGRGGQGGPGAGGPPQGGR